MPNKGYRYKSSLVAEEYVRKYPKHGSLTIARLIIKEHPLLYSSLNAARLAVRNVRGTSGKKNRKAMNKTKTPIVERALPKSTAKPRKPYSLPSGKTLVLSDIHIPYHDVKALEIALTYADEYKPDNILLNGDTIDFYSISRWQKDPEERNLPQEIEKTRQFVMHLKDRFPEARLIWKNGNHEDRWEAYLWNKAPELIGMSEFELRKILWLDDYGFDFVHSKQRIKAGKHLTILHGHEIFGAHNPVNPARTLAVKLKVCALKGHNHQTSEHTDKDGDGKYITCWSTGCLSELTPDYMPFNNWSHGFATVELDANDFVVDNYRIIDGKIR